MRLRLEDALSEALSWQEDVEVAPKDFGRDDLLELSAIRTRGELRSIDGGYLLSGNVSYRQDLACTRCLEPAAEDVETSFEVFLVPHGGASESFDRISGGETEAAMELELEADDLNVVSVTGEGIDTIQFALEQVMLHLTPKALCQTDCAGLCPTCGDNLNTQGCACEPVADPRWGALATLKNQLAEHD